MTARTAQPPTNVELATRHKLGLSLSNPVLLASGIIGYGDAVAPGFEVTQLGGYVTAPVTRRAWRVQPPQVVEVPGGVLWQRGWWNPGVRRIIRDYASLWRYSPVPVIVHLAGHEPGELTSVATEFEQMPGIAGLEIDLPMDASDASEMIWATREAADLPLLARIPLSVSDDTVQAVIDAGADALVLAQPPAGLHVDPASGRQMRGEFYGPGLLSQITARIADLAAWARVPLVACGGVHSLESALMVLAAGAAALQVDAIAWVDPLLPGRIAQALAGKQRAPSTAQIDHAALS